MNPFTFYAIGSVFLVFNFYFLGRLAAFPKKCHTSAAPCNFRCRFLIKSVQRIRDVD